MKKKQKEIPGSIFKVVFDPPYFTYGRILNFSVFAFYDFRIAHEIDNLEDIVASDILFRSLVNSEGVEYGRWQIIGHLPLDENLQHSKYWIEDLGDNRCTIVTDGNYNYNRPIEDAFGLEHGGIWDPTFVEERLRDHYAGRINKMVTLPGVPKNNNIILEEPSDEIVKVSNFVVNAAKFLSGRKVKHPSVKAFAKDKPETFYYGNLNALKEEELKLKALVETLSPSDRKEFERLIGEYAIANLEVGNAELLNSNTKQLSEKELKNVIAFIHTTAGFIAESQRQTGISTKLSPLVDQVLDSNDSDQLLLLRFELLQLAKHLSSHELTELGSQLETNVGKGIDFYFQELSDEIDVIRERGEILTEAEYRLIESRVEDLESTVDSDKEIEELDGLLMTFQS
jgi:hypothetical protein